MRTIIFAGTIRGYEDFLQRFEFRPADVKRVDDMDRLRGYKDAWLVYGWGFQWLPNDRTIAFYCLQHNVAIMSEQAFALEYMTGRGQI